MKLVSFGTRVSGEEPITFAKDNAPKIGPRGFKTLKTVYEVGSMASSLALAVTALGIISAYRGYREGLEGFIVKHPKQRPPSFLEAAGVLKPQISKE